MRECGNGGKGGEAGPWQNRELVEQAELLTDTVIDSTPLHSMPI